MSNRTTVTNSGGYNNQATDDNLAENIPPIDLEYVPREVKLPKKLWPRIFTLLVEAPNRSLSQHELVLAYSKRFKESLGGKNFLTKYHVRTINHLICALPDVEPIRLNGVMKYTLRSSMATYSRYSYRDKIDRMEAKTLKPVVDEDAGEEDDFDDSDGDEDDNDDNNDNDFNIPDQPPEMLPQYASMPVGLRRTIYKLLVLRYKKGVELKAFRDAYTKYYSSSISNYRDCRMGHDEMFYCLRDIVEIEKDEAERMWLKPRPINEIRKLHVERPLDIFCVAPIFKEFEEKREMDRQKKERYRPGRSFYSPSTSTKPKPPRFQKNGGDQWNGYGNGSSRNGFIPVNKLADSDTGFEDHPSTSTTTVASKLSDSDTSHSETPNEKKKIIDDDNDYDKHTFKNIVKPSDPSTLNNGHPQVPFRYAPGIGRGVRIATAPIKHLVNSNVRTNEARADERQRMAANRLASMKEKWMESWDDDDQEEYISNNRNNDTTPKKITEIVREEKPLEMELYDALRPYNDWIEYEAEICDIYERKYGKILEIPSSSGEIPSPSGRSVCHVFKNYPELFALSNENSVKARPPPILSYPVLAVQSISDFGIQDGDVFAGAFKKLQLVENEVMEVLVSFVKENGDIYIQLKSMEPAFNDMDYDMNSFYANPFNNEKYVMNREVLQPNLPVAVFTNSNWRRAVVIDVLEDNVFIELVDFGQSYWIERKCLRFLRCAFVDGRVTPCAVLVRLAGIVADTDKNAPRISDAIYETIENAGTINVVVKSTKADDGIPLVEMSAYFGPDGRKLIVNDELIHLGAAALNISVQKPSSSISAPTISNSRYPITTNFPTKANVLSASTPHPSTTAKPAPAAAFTPVGSDGPHASASARSAFSADPRPSSVGVLVRTAGAHTAAAVSAPVNDLDASPCVSPTSSELPKLVNVNRFSDSDSSGSDNILAGNKAALRTSTPVALVNFDSSASSSAPAISSDQQQPTPPAVEEVPLLDYNTVSDDADPALTEVLKILAETLNDKNLTAEQKNVYKSTIENMLKKSE